MDLMLDALKQPISAKLQGDFSLGLTVFADSLLEIRDITDAMHSAAAEAMRSRS